jgi:hypothetical protein
MDTPTCAKDAVDKNSAATANSSERMMRIRIRSPFADYPPAASVSTFVYSLPSFKFTNGNTLPIH